jgi:hypothetical protein
LQFFGQMPFLLLFYTILLFFHNSYFLLTSQKINYINNVIFGGNFYGNIFHFMGRNLAMT